MCLMAISTTIHLLSNGPTLMFKSLSMLPLMALLMLLSDMPIWPGARMEALDT